MKLIHLGPEASAYHDFSHYVNVVITFWLVIVILVYLNMIDMKKYVITNYKVMSERHAIIICQNDIIQI